MLEFNSDRPKILVWSPKRRLWLVECYCCDIKQEFSLYHAATHVAGYHAQHTHPYSGSIRSFMAEHDDPGLIDTMTGEPSIDMTQPIQKIQDVPKTRPRIWTIRGRRREKFTYEEYQPGTQMDEINSWMK
jgi:hypothetical protein